jgi:folate-binding protein YgfZ
MAGERCDDRAVLQITGEDRTQFLQGLVSNDVRKLDQGLVYAALLNPQGKYLADFFMVPAAEAILIDVHRDLAKGLAQRLAMYKLRAKVEIAESPLLVRRGLGKAPEGAFSDPRHTALGWRLYSEEPGGAPSIDWDAVRVAHCIPETGRELGSETYILEAGFERLHGVDFRKGCYVGQEVTARMKHKTELRKGLATIDIEGAAQEGAEITRGGRPAGVLHTRAGDRAIAYLRFDRAGPDMQAADATLSWTG